MISKTDLTRKSRQQSIQMEQLDIEDNKAVMAQSREYEAQKRKYAQDHWTEELAQKQKLKGEVIKGNDIVTKLK